MALSLPNFRLVVSFVAALPANPLADACIRFLHDYGVNTSYIGRQGERIGIYFLEGGANQRASNVVYDRAHASISTAKAADFDWDAIFDGAGWFHITGITPAISATAAERSLHAARAAHDRGVTVSCDYNFRKELWQYGRTSPRP